MCSFLLGKHLRCWPWCEVRSSEAFIPSDSPQSLLKILFRPLDSKPDLINQYLQGTHNGTRSLGDSDDWASVGAMNFEKPS